jgi:hypothetical protein
MAMNIEMGSIEQEKRITEYILKHSDTVRFFSESVLSLSHKGKLDGMLAEMKEEFLIKEIKDAGFIPFMTNEFYSFHLTKRLKDLIREKGLFVFNMEGGPLYSLIEPEFFSKGKLFAEVDSSGAKSVVLHIDSEQAKELKAPAKAEPSKAAKPAKKSVKARASGKSKAKPKRK